MRNAAKVLIVDDDKSSSQMLSEVVKRMGLKPIVATKAIDALNMVKLQTVHAAVVDVLLPKMSGVDLVSEFRKTKFGDNPVVLVSGVFKDKNFAAEAIKKTAAVDFLFKPFGAEELMASLNAAFKEAIGGEKWTVSALLTKPLPTARDRAKAIEHLESINGNDFLYVLSLLLEPYVSGHMNIVNETGEIFGVTITRGTITDVDSTESQSAGVLALISKGFLNQQDWDEFQAAGNKKFTLERLVQEGYVSPHAVTLAKTEQILADIKSICSAESIRVNFGTADTEDNPPKHAVEMPHLMKVIVPLPDEYLKPDYLKNFYASVKNASFQLINGAEYVETHWADPLFAGMNKLKTAVLNGGTIDQVLTAEPDSETAVYRAVHYLVLSREIKFADVEHAKDLSSSLDRYRKMFEELSARTPDQIFEYFGAAPMAPAKTVESLYDQYVKSNAPDKLPKDASAELRTACQKCFDLIKNAKDIMVDDTRRTELTMKKRSEGAEKIKKSNEMVARGLDILRKGQFAQALQILNEAEALHHSSVGFLILTWAEVKAGGEKVDKAQATKILKKLERLPQEERKSAYYFMAMGLVKKALGDGTAAGYFDKALEVDSTLSEARRELSSISGAAKDAKKADILTGDISTVISNLFKRKID